MGCSDSEDKPLGKTARLQQAVQVDPDELIHLKVAETDTTEQIQKTYLIGDRPQGNPGLPEHELPFCKELLGVWFCGYQLDDNKTIEECEELCNVCASPFVSLHPH